MQISFGSPMRGLASDYFKIEFELYNICESAYESVLECILEVFRF